MNYESVESYYIKEDELNVLLAGAGIDSWYGISVSDPAEEEGRSMDESGLNRVLADLYQKNYINWEPDGIRVLEPAASLVTIIKDASGCRELIFDKETVPTILIYINEGRCLSLEESPWDPCMYRFYFMDTKNLDAFIDSCRFQLKEIKTKALVHGRLL